VRVKLSRDRTSAYITVVESEEQSVTTTVFPVVRIKLEYTSGMAAVIQRVGQEKWDGPVKVFWTGCQYTVDEIVEIIQQVRDANAMDDLDKGPVVVHFREPSLLTEPGTA
jgi:hypothetical protein